MADKKKQSDVCNFFFPAAKGQAAWDVGQDKLAVRGRIKKINK